MTDVQTELFSMFGELNATLGGMRNEQKAMRRQLQEWRSLQETPRFIRIHGSMTLDPATAFGVMRFDNDGPDEGRMWYLRKLAITGVTPTTTVAGRADIYVSTMDYRRFTSLAQMGTTDLVDSATSLPMVGVFGSGEIPLQYMEQLFLVFSGGTNSQEVHAQGIIEDFQTGAYKQDWAL